MTDPGLKLVSPPSAAKPDSYRLNRRRLERHHLSGRVTAVADKPDAQNIHGRICSLQLLNISDQGLGVISQDPLDLDSAITVFFPAHGPERGFDAWGHVVRCTPREYGHELGIRLEARPAA